MITHHVTGVTTAHAHKGLPTFRAVNSARLSGWCRALVGANRGGQIFRSREGEVAGDVPTFCFLVDPVYEVPSRSRARAKKEGTL